MLESLLQVSISCSSAAAAPSLSALPQLEIPPGQCIMGYCLAMKVLAAVMFRANASLHCHLHTTYLCTALTALVQVLR